MPARTANRSLSRLLRRYGIVTPDVDGTSELPRHAWRVSLGGHRRADGQKMLTLTIGNVAESRPCPVAHAESENVVRRFSRRHLLPKDPALQRTLEDLVSRSGKLYADEPIDGFVFDAVDVGDGGYRIGSVHINMASTKTAD